MPRFKNRPADGLGLESIIAVHWYILINHLLTYTVCILKFFIGWNKGVKRMKGLIKGMGVTLKNMTQQEHYLRIS